MTTGDYLGFGKAGERPRFMPDAETNEQILRRPSNPDNLFMSRRDNPEEKFKKSKQAIAKAGRGFIENPNTPISGATLGGALVHLCESVYGLKTQKERELSRQVISYVRGQIGKIFDLTREDPDQARNDFMNFMTGFMGEFAAGFTISVINDLSENGEVEIERASPWEDLRRATDYIVYPYGSAHYNQDPNSPFIVLQVKSLRLPSKKIFEANQVFFNLQDSKDNQVLYSLLDPSQSDESRKRADKVIDRLNILKEYASKIGGLPVVMVIANEKNFEADFNFESGMPTEDFIDRANNSFQRLVAEIKN